MIHNSDNTVLHLDIDIYGLVVAFGIPVCIQYLSDNVLFYVECILFKSKYCNCRCWNLLASFDRAIYFFIRKRYIKSVVMYLAEHCNFIWIWTDIQSKFVLVDYSLRL